MSDAIETTGSGATRVLFGTVAFICLMVGIEGITGADNISTGLSIILIASGAVCAYAAFFWESAKRALSDEAQAAIAGFARHKATKAALMLTLLISVTLSPFVEQHRWPFSYPADPAILSENNDLKITAQANQQDAVKWRLAHYLRTAPKASNGALLGCKFSLTLSAGDIAWNLWLALQPILDLAHWENISQGNSINADAPFTRLNVLVSKNDDVIKCGAELAKSLTTAFPQASVSFQTEQSSMKLLECKNECVDLEIGNQTVQETHLANVCVRWFADLG